MSRRRDSAANDRASTLQTIHRRISLYGDHDNGHRPCGRVRLVQRHIDVADLSTELIGPAVPIVDPEPDQVTRHVTRYLS